MKDRFVDLLLANPIGRIIAGNIFQSLKEGLIERGILEAFLKNCLEAYEEDSVGTPEELVGQIEDVAWGDRPINSARRRQFLFACSRRTGDLIDMREFSTVKKIHVLRYLLSDSALAYGHGSILSNPDPADPALADAVNRIDSRSDIYRAGARLSGVPNRPIFWIAPSELVSATRRRSALDAGDAVRDILGLIHIEEDIVLVEIRIPGDQLSGRRHARPSVADAGSHRRFKVSPDGALAKKRSSWGWTVHLGRFADGNVNIDGVPERVVEAIDFDERLGAKIEFVGVTRSLRGHSGDDDIAFAERVSMGTSISDIKNSLQDILS